MKAMKRICGIVLAVCLIVPCFLGTVEAADGVLTFSDPTTAVGETFDVKVKIRTQGEAIGDGFATVKYDPAALKYVSGTNTSGGDGTVELKATGDGSQSELEYMIQFTALTEGTAVLEVTDYTSYLFNDEKLHLSLGSSKITIGPGTAPADAQTPDAAADQPQTAAVAGDGNIDIGGVKYHISDDFSDALIPIGYQRAEMQIDGANHSVAKMELGEVVLVYLDNGTNADFFYMNQEDGSYTGVEQVEIARDNYILLLQGKGGVSLPEKYEETTFEYSGKQFPAWQDPSQVGFCIVNAIDSRGQKTLYQVDAQDKTYQRFEVQADTTEELGKLGGNLEKIFNWLHENIEKALIGLWVFIVVVILIIIILSSKLHNRNRELDDLYDEYGIDDEPKKKGPKGGQKSSKKAAPQPVRRQPAKPKKEEMNWLDLEDEDDEEEDYDIRFEMDDEDEDEFEDSYEDDDDFEDDDTFDSYEDYDKGYDVDPDEEDSYEKDPFDLNLIRLD